MSPEELTEIERSANVRSLGLATKRDLLMLVDEVRSAWGEKAEIKQRLDDMDRENDELTGDRDSLRTALAAFDDEIDATDRARALVALSPEVLAVVDEALGRCHEWGLLERAGVRYCVRCGVTDSDPPTAIRFALCPAAAVVLPPDTK